MTLKLLLEICGLFAVLFCAGVLACLPLFHWNLIDFFRSRLWLKTRLWIPLFAIFCLLLYVQLWAAWLITLIIIAQAYREFTLKAGWRVPFVCAYVFAFMFCILHLPLYFYAFPVSVAVSGIVGIGFASVLSDVFAFFGGTYLGKHRLPAYINPDKSYEGVIGQLVGAWVGLALAAMLPGVAFSWQLALAVGIASAAGDICNSIAKRMLAIKDWGSAIPGHGGVLDRFASLSFAIAFGFWVLYLKL